MNINRLKVVGGTGLEPVTSSLALGVARFSSPESALLLGEAAAYAKLNLVYALY